MPIYEYAVREGAAGCPFCRPGFTREQRITEPRLETCPECGGPVERLLFAVGISTPHTAAELKNLGFKKLVRRDTGVYENVTATGGESRIWEADKPHTMPDIKGVISD